MLSESRLPSWANLAGSVAIEAFGAIVVGEIAEGAVHQSSARVAAFANVVVPTAPRHQQARPLQHLNRYHTLFPNETKHSWRYTVALKLASYLVGSNSTMGLSPTALGFAAATQAAIFASVKSPPTAAGLGVSSTCFLLFP